MEYRLGFSICVAGSLFVRIGICSSSETGSRILITAGHSIAQAVRSTSYSNGNSDYRGNASTKTGGARELKIGTIDYFGPLTPHAKMGRQSDFWGLPGREATFNPLEFLFLFTCFFRHAYGQILWADFSI